MFNLTRRPLWVFCLLCLSLAAYAEDQTEEAAGADEAPASESALPAKTLSKIQLGNSTGQGAGISRIHQQGAETIASGKNAKASLGTVDIKTTTNDVTVNNNLEINGAANLATGSGSEVRAGAVSGE